MTDRKKSKKQSDTINEIIKAMKHLVLHNGWIKLIAIMISVFLWAGLVSQDDSITRDKTFQNVSVSVTGAESMKSSGFIVVSDLNELLNNVSIVAAVPQKQYDNAEASAYNVRLDLSRVKGVGQQEVKLLSTNSSTFGKVSSISPSSVNVQVEDYIIRQRIPVSFSTIGEIPDNWYMTTPTVDPALVAVTGPSSMVKTISRARVYINTDDIEWKEGSIITSSEIHLFNRAGDEVNSPLLGTTSSSLTIDSVVIETNILPCESFETVDLVQVIGNVADGYEIKNVRLSPEVITVAARNEVLEQMSDLPIERTTVNVNDLTETTVFQLKVQKPSDDSIISNETITVTVEIEATESETEP